MSTYPDVKFKRVRKGYDPQEADAVFEEFTRQIADYKKQIYELNDIIKKYDKKMKQVSESTQRLGKERMKESLRLTGIINNAAQIAEQIERDAHKQAEEILTAAQLEADSLKKAAQQESEQLKEATRQELKKMKEDAVRDAENFHTLAQADFLSLQTFLIKLRKDTKQIRKNYGQYLTNTTQNLTEIDSLIENALIGAPSVSSSIAHQSIEPALPTEKSRELSSQPSLPDSAEKTNDSKPLSKLEGLTSEAYESFLKSMKLTGKGSD